MTEGKKRIPWTPNEIATMTAILESGGTYQDVCNATGRTIASVMDKAWSLGLRLKNRAKRQYYGPSRKPKPSGPTTPRSCLCCAKEFESEGKHNRLCFDCRRKDGGFEDASMPGRLSL